MEETGEVHSADFFGPLRDSWWNRDYLELLVRRLRIHTAASVLDVGCGQGHWGQALAHALPSGSTMRGVDREETSLVAARRRSEALDQLPIRFEYETGDVLALDFADDTFDVVTCQTLLIHIDRPPDAIAEMVRVLKPGGWLLCAEPNNLAGGLSIDTTAWANGLESLLAGVELQYRCELGKARLGEGFNSAGELLPGWLAAVPLDSLQVYVSDKALPAWPPYATAEMKEMVAQARRNLEEQRLTWTQAETLRYWLAGGGDAERFEELWQEGLADLRRVVNDIALGTWSSAGGTLMYVVAGRKVSG